MIEEEFDGNNHDGGHTEAPADLSAENILKAPLLKLSDLRKDGVFNKVDIATTQSVLQRAMSAINKEEDILQEIKTAFFTSTRQQNAFAAVIAYDQRYGIDVWPDIIWLVAHNAGINGARLNSIFDALTHSTFTMNQNNKQKDKVKKNGSPLS